MPALTLERLLAGLGFGSRKECRALVRMGIVSLDGKILEDPFLEFEKRPETLVVNGEEIPTEETVYGMLYKPLGYECSARPQHHASAFELLPERFAGMNVRFVGRLDVDSSGLLLFSNNGTFIHKIESPKTGIAKRYRVTLARPLEISQIEFLKQGVLLNNEKRAVRAQALDVITEKVVEIEITEGLYHQVRRMFAAVGNHVLELERLAIGKLRLDVDFKPGDWRFLSASEIGVGNI